MAMRSFLFGFPHTKAMGIRRCFWTFMTFATIARAIWPAPSTFETGSKVLWVDPTTLKFLHLKPRNKQDANGQIHIELSPLSESIVARAARNAYSTIFEANYIPWTFHERNAPFEPSTAAMSMITNVNLTQTQVDPPNVLKAQAGEVDESYKLTISEHGDANIEAITSIGLVRGLTSFTQLFYEHSAGFIYTPFAPISISDAPRFSHRGIHLDVARTFIPVADILRTIDAAAYNKFNRLHLHMADAQSWPLEIPSLPELSLRGAYTQAQTYTPSDLLTIQQYAAFQGVQVMIEIDLSAHAGSLGYSHPELFIEQEAACPDPSAEQQAQQASVSDLLDLNSPSLNSFITMLLSDLLPRISPYTSTYPTGGSDIQLVLDALKTNPDAVLPLLQPLIDDLHIHVRNAGMTPMIHSDLLKYNLTLGADVIVQTPLQEQSDTVNTLADIISKNHRVVARSSAWDLSGGRRDWREVYASSLLVDQVGACVGNADLVLGGEVYLSSRVVDMVGLDAKLWPRAAAVGEALWTGRREGGEDGDGENMHDVVRRLADMRERLVKRGVSAEAVTMPYCLMNREVCR